jgi:hypothetical protein
MSQIDSAASTGGQKKYIKCVSFPWPPVVAALATSTFCFLFTRYLLSMIFERNDLTSVINKYNF